MCFRSFLLALIAVGACLSNAFGFVWTDGPPGIAFGNGFNIVLEVTDSSGQQHGQSFKPSVNSNRNGQTSEDVFLGIVVNKGITHVNIRAVYYGELGEMPYMEIDHLQYGRIIPEPPCLELTLFLIGSIIFSNRVFVFCV